MNYNKNVVILTLVSTFLFFVGSLLTTFSGVHFLDLDRISIVSDIFQKENLFTHTGSLATPELNGTDSAKLAEAETRALDSPINGGNATKKLLYKYSYPKTLTNFRTDASKPSLPAFMGKLVALKNGKKQKVRIAWFGDSMIEGDLLSQTFRKRMQEYFGGYFGVGFIPANSVVAGFRNTATHKWTGEWKEENFKTKTPSSPLYLSGHTYFTADGELMIKDKTHEDTAHILEKSLLCGPAEGGIITLSINGQPKQFTADKKMNRILLDRSNNPGIDVAVKNSKLPVYGISFEPEEGVVVDNFSFRGISGIELGKLDSSFLGAINTENAYDLVILEYGANLMYHPGDTDYSWYRRAIIPVIRRLQNEMPNAEFLIIGAADRAFLYDQTWKTAAGMDNLVKTQAELACNNNTAFFNMYASMGGAGTIVNWAETTPPLANKDYIHPNFRGADLLGNMLYDAFIKDYKKAAQTN